MTYQYLIFFFFWATIIPISAQRSASSWRQFTTTTYNLNTASRSVQTQSSASRSSTHAHTLLPLVFHIVYHSNDSPLTWEEIRKQVDALNRHFSLKEFLSKQEQYGPQDFDSLAVDTEIRFCLLDVNFVASDSIIFYDDQSIKKNATGGSNPQRPQECINVWVGSLHETSGYAQMPGKLYSTDGIVIDKDFFGQGHPPYDEGKTLTHLIGNFLGLHDIWGPSYCADDGIDDTPLHNAPNFTHISPGDNHMSCCHEGSREMYMNYMDNTEDSLLYMFTSGQKDKMMNTLQTSRKELKVDLCSHAFSSPKEVAISGVNIFPNPVDHQLRVQISGNPLFESLLVIHNSLGQIMYTRSLQGQFDGLIDVSQWSDGLYLLTVEGGIIETLPFVKN